MESVPIGDSQQGVAGGVGEDVRDNDSAYTLFELPLQSSSPHRVRDETFKRVESLGRQWEGVFGH